MLLNWSNYYTSQSVIKHLTIGTVVTDCGGPTHKVTITKFDFKPNRFTGSLTLEKWEPHLFGDLRFVLIWEAISPAPYDLVWYYHHTCILNDKEWFCLTNVECGCVSINKWLTSFISLGNWRYIKILYYIRRYTVIQAILWHY